MTFVDIINKENLYDIDKALNSWSCITEFKETDKISTEHRFYRF